MANGAAVPDRQQPRTGDSAGLGVTARKEEHDVGRIVVTEYISPWPTMEGEYAEQAQLDAEGHLSND